MSRELSPIERMIDQACGVPKHEGVFLTWLKARGKTIALECCTCHSTRDVVREKSDPQAAVKAVFPCPNCWPDTSSPLFEEYVGKHGELLVKYYDKDGNQLTAAWQAQG